MLEETISKNDVGQELTCEDWLLLEPLRWERHSWSHLLARWDVGALTTPTIPFHVRSLSLLACCRLSYDSANNDVPFITLPTLTTTSQSPSPRPVFHQQWQPHYLPMSTYPTIPAYERSSANSARNRPPQKTPNNSSTRSQQWSAQTPWLTAWTPSKRAQ